MRHADGRVQMISTALGTMKIQQWYGLRVFRVQTSHASIRKKPVLKLKCRHIVSQGFGVYCLQEYFTASLPLPCPWLSIFSFSFHLHAPSGPHVNFLQMPSAHSSPPFSMSLQFQHALDATLLTSLDFSPCDFNTLKLSTLNHNDDVVVLGQRRTWTSEPCC